eukprot:CAMPEP_0170546490 /NCGR_PEP_ID=MMETSP0211-20121228/4846_1 /TAXON_ID=311385 /ORGANISM="Pseudokeronopsis sp., Strain OXSARD2" /LENGTH=80 /DNA_ID=CAMNT_0010850983 /DNA_START=557 /DNA_END=799 /DNA_ORIENTATION=-
MDDQLEYEVGCHYHNELPYHAYLKANGLIQSLDFIVLDDGKVHFEHFQDCYGVAHDQNEDEDVYRIDEHPNEVLDSIYID